MNRSLINVILGGVGTKSQGTGQAKAIEGIATEATSQQVMDHFQNYMKIHMDSHS